MVGVSASEGAETSRPGVLGTSSSSAWGGVGGLRVLTASRWGSVLLTSTSTSNSSAENVKSNKSGFNMCRFVENKAKQNALYKPVA